MKVKVFLFIITLYYYYYYHHDPITTRNILLSFVLSSLLHLPLPSAAVVEGMQYNINTQIYTCYTISIHPYICAETSTLSHRVDSAEDVIYNKKIRAIYFF